MYRRRNRSTRKRNLQPIQSLYASWEEELSILLTKFDRDVLQGTYTLGMETAYQKERKRMEAKRGVLSPPTWGWDIPQDVYIQHGIRYCTRIENLFQTMQEVPAVPEDGTSISLWLRSGLTGWVREVRARMLSGAPCDKTIQLCWQRFISCLRWIIDTATAMKEQQEQEEQLLFR